MALSVQDRYVGVVTARGRAALLRRDVAAREAARLEGLELHRWHWDALDRVAARRVDDAAGPAPRTAGEVPVGQARLAQVRTAGLPSGGASG